MGQKRRRQPVNVNTELVEIYEDLADQNEQIRLKAASALLRCLASGKSSTGDEVLRALKRLFRGLCSSRKAARLGFSVALTELLVTYANAPGSSLLSLDDVFETLKTQTSVNGEAKGQEERDYLWGKVFGVEAVIESGILFTDDRGVAKWGEILDLVLELAKKKPWLRAECGWILLRRAQKLVESPNGAELSKVLVEKLVSFNLAKSPEGVALWIAVRSSFEEVLPKKVWHHRNPLNRKELSSLAKVLRETSSAATENTSDDSKALNRGSWSHQVHFAWNICFDASRSSKDDQTKFSDLWTQAVEDGLFSNAASDERKHWGFSILQQQIGKASTEEMPVLLGDKLIHCLINHFADKTRYLNSAARKTVTAINERMRTDNDMAASVLAAFFRNGVEKSNVRNLLKSRILDDIMRNVPIVVESGPFAIYLGFVTRIFSDETTPDPQKRDMAEHFTMMIKSYDMAKSKRPEFSHMQSSITSILNLMAGFAYFGAHLISKAQPLSNGASHNAMKSPEPIFTEKLMAVLARLTGKDQESTYYIKQVARQIREYERSTMTSSFGINSDEEVRKSMEKSMTHLDKLLDMEKLDQGNSLGLRHLYCTLLSLVLIEAYNVNPDAISMAEELNQSYQGYDNDQLDKSQEMLFEIMLSFASRPSQLFRQVAEHVMRSAGYLLDENSLLSMLQVLETKESVVGQDEMFNRQDDVESEGHGEDVEMVDAEASDVEELNDESKSKSDQSSTEDDLQEIESEVDANEDEDEVAAFESKLALALGTRRGQDDLEATDMSGEEASDLDDDAMEALDAQIANIFREHQKLTKKQDRKAAKENIVNFKLRVLDLLEIYLKSHHTAPLALLSLEPLIQLVDSTASKLVSVKAAALIQQFQKLCKAKLSSNPNEGAKDRAIEVLETVHNLASREGSHAYGNSCSNASLACIKAYLSNGGDVQEISLALGALWVGWFSDPKQYRVRPQFWADHVNWVVNQGSSR